MIRKQVYLDENIIEQIKEIAKQKNISQSELIRRSLTEYIKKQQVEGKAKDPLLELVRLVNEEIEDGSENHDKYIYGKYDQDGE